ncbi:hypothetical protein CP985_07630 [Malaciobacter mytili LMG 24559]|uniref:Nucleoid-associated protein n=1 Tax=Malaciobacter mytili LMG 24559 TaxID=1032238 RepID=A0AAX2AHE3_9BACT|nr:nucleoid-associated protein [Malaciobacter mytili]AXH15111.1 nucleoid-associated protein [Malaciobacter mytili LMG 24559]RXK15621.1 hypothetical protein CP985_07630 [Malaciobacter mytili LMG 24559]
MKVKSVVVHILHKEQASKQNSSPRATIDFSNKLFDINNQTVEGFSEKLAMTYFDGKSRFYTNFKKTESAPRFQENINKLLESTYDFLKFSKVITEDLKEEMDGERMSSGGYLIVMDYESSNNYRYLFVALLNNKIEYSISKTLELSQFLSLNIDKMAMASVINITKYVKKEDNYITFLKGIREIPDYFIKFMGADKDAKRDLREQTKKWIEAIGAYLKEDEIQNKDIQLIIQELIQKVKQLKKEEKFMTAETIANIIEPSNPEKFISYIYDEKNNFQVNPELETMDTRILSNYGIIRYENKQKDFLLKFSKKSIGDIISFDNKKDIVTINDKDIVKGIKAEIDMQEDSK